MSWGTCCARSGRRSTLFLIASKSFTTAETMLNAHSARTWFLANGGTETDIQRHFVALTTDTCRLPHSSASPARWGSGTGWADGFRCSLRLACRLRLRLVRRSSKTCCTVRMPWMRIFLAPLVPNLPLRLGMLDVWNRDFCGFGSRCIAPYSHGCAA